jgi:hypothetical protein
MTHSDSIKELAAALAKAQATMTGAKKDSANPFFKSKYADLASCWEAARASLPAHGLSIIQTTRASERDEVVVITTLAHASGEWISGELSLPVSKADAQGYGSALTYARRYGLCAIVGIAPEDDDGNAAAAARPITGKQVAIDQLESMTPEEQTFLRDHAMAILALPVEETAAYVKAQNFDNDEKLALWSLLPPKVRSAIKAGSQRNLGEQA